MAVIRSARRVNLVFGPMASLDIFVLCISGGSEKQGGAREHRRVHPAAGAGP